jgi:hypothetical protein
VKYLNTTVHKREDSDIHATHETVINSTLQHVSATDGFIPLASKNSKQLFKW